MAGELGRGGRAEKLIHAHRASLLGHLANIGTMVYFAVLLGGGGMAAHGLFERLTG